MNELQTWLNTSVVRAIQQLNEASHGPSHGDGIVQILLNVLDGSKLKLTTVAQQREEKLHLRNEVGDRELGLKQWYDFRNQVWAGIYYQVAEKIQVLGPYVHQDSADKLNNGCELFREELGVHLS